MRQFYPALWILGAALTLTNAGAATHYVSANGKDAGAGTKDSPWRTIQHAADSLKPGDAIYLYPGVYREEIHLTHGGTAAKPVAIQAIPGSHVIVTGADAIRDGWEKVEGAIYRHDWSYRFPIGGPDDLTHPGDKEHELTGRAEQVIHHGRLLRQVLHREQLSHGSFFVDLDAKKLYVWLRDGGNPADEDVEASARSRWLYNDDGVSYVHLSGIDFRYAANHAQRGAFALYSSVSGEKLSKGWIVQDCVFEKANGPGASMSGEGHLFQRCVFQDNGQLGFGTSSCNHTRMVECGIYRNNAKGYSTGWEAGGLKVTMSRGFSFDRCRSVDNRGTGIWFDIGNEDSEVKNCYIADNDEAGIFYEISYGLRAHDNLIANNANLGESVGGGWSEAGITLSSSQNCVIESNTLVGNRDGIALREQDRTTPRIGGTEKEERIYNKGHVLKNNLIAYSAAYNIGFWMDTTFFGPHPSGGDRNSPISEDPKTLGIKLANNLLWPLPYRPNYLYGVPWRPKSHDYIDPKDFADGTGIPDTSIIADPLFIDVLAGNYGLKPNSPARKKGVGIREPSVIPVR